MQIDVGACVITVTRNHHKRAVADLDRVLRHQVVRFEVDLALALFLEVPVEFPHLLLQLLLLRLRSLLALPGLDG